MIIDLRGTGGAGKSYVGHNLLDRYGWGDRDDDGLRSSLGRYERIMLPAQTEFNTNKKKPKLAGYHLPGGLVILGAYEAKSGGLELGFTGQQGEDYVAQACRRYEHVFVEALFISLVIGRYRDLQAQLISEGYEYETAFLNTPMDVCRERILERRGPDYDGPPISEKYTIRRNWTRLHNNIRPRFLEAGLPAPYVPYEDAVAWIDQRFRAAGWDPTKPLKSGRKKEEI